MACPEGLEPPTYSLEGYCSIQLSYGQQTVLSVWQTAARRCQAYDLRGWIITAASLA